MEKDDSYFSQLNMLWNIFSKQPDARARIRGSLKYPNTKGLMHFYEMINGTLVVTEMMRLPHKKGICERGIFALHLHDGESCTGTEADFFANAGMHFNPNMCEHPYHAGDMPPLFENEGYALSVFLTNQFLVRDVIGKTVIVHGNPDDFTTQPSGNAGEKIACGVIEII